MEGNARLKEKDSLAFLQEFCRTQLWLTYSPYISPTEPLYRFYKQTCKENGIKPLSPRKFIRALEEHYGYDLEKIRLRKMQLPHEIRWFYRPYGMMLQDQYRGLTVMPVDFFKRYGNDPDRNGEKFYNPYKLPDVCPFCNKPYLPFGIVGWVFCMYCDYSVGSTDWMIERYTDEPLMFCPSCKGKFVWMWERFFRCVNCRVAMKVFDYPFSRTFKNPQGD